MDFISILLVMFKNLHGERSAQGVYHILKGKKSGQTLQDVENYQLKPFYSLFPNLPAVDFQRMIDDLTVKGFIEHEGKVVRLTPVGMQHVPDRRWQFNGWEFRGKEREFFRRLALAVQTLSHLKVGDPAFTPIQKELHTQQFVGDFIRSRLHSAGQLANELQEEIKWVLHHAELDEEQRAIFVYRLTGRKMTAYTWEQIGELLQTAAVRAQLLFLESLHIVLDVVEQHENLPVLRKLAEGCRAQTYLTQSAEQTRKLFSYGYSLEQIAALRNLRISTIEDHFIEMAANQPDFPFGEFITDEQTSQVWKLIDRLHTKRLRLLKEQFSELSYFQLRLIIMAGRRVTANGSS